MIKFKTFILKSFDIIFSPFVYLSSKYLRFIRFKGVDRMTVSREIFRKAGVFPVTSHYYDPYFTKTKLGKRNLNASIDFNVNHQLSFLDNLNYHSEIDNTDWETMLNSGESLIPFPFFQPLESEYYYNIVRYLKPKNIIEIGSGYSTKVCLLASEKNAADGFHCIVTCIEPYENHWLEKTSANILRRKVEDLGTGHFDILEENDILFIDSSHIIKPESDVLFEYLELLPSLKSGVYIHIHDIFSPDYYPEEWLVEKVSFWNEQYLLEAFLSYNKSFEVIGSLNYLYNNYYEKLSNNFSSLKNYPQRPSSFWIMKK